MKGQTSVEKRKKMRRNLEHRGSSNLRVNLFSTPTKKRRRNDQNFQKQQAESFIMKLFDRSLDLSKYTETTPLYPICRAWMLNQPRNPSITNYREASASDEKKHKRENNGAELLRRVQRGDPIIVNALPAPLNIEVPKMPRLYDDFKPDLDALDKALNAKDDSENKDENKTEAEDAKTALLAEHKIKWCKTKNNWLKQARNCDKRYELNQLILTKLFK